MVQLLIENGNSLIKNGLITVKNSLILLKFDFNQNQTLIGVKFHC